MKIVSTIARYLLGLMFTVFGLNGFLNFIHQPPPTNPLAIQFFIAISASHFAAFFFAVQLIGGLLLLSGYFVPLALTLLAAELFNILARWLATSGHNGANCGWGRTSRNFRYLSLRNRSPRPRSSILGNDQTCMWRSRLMTTALT